MNKSCVLLKCPSEPTWTKPGPLNMKQLLFTSAFLTSSCPHVSCGKDCKGFLMEGLIRPRRLPPHEMFDPLLTQKIANYFIGWHFHTSRYYRKVRRCLHWGNWIFLNYIFALRNDWFIKIVTASLKRHLFVKIWKVTLKQFLGSFASRWTSPLRFLPMKTGQCSAGHSE